MTFAVIDVQGFQLDNRFVPKEIALTNDGINIQHFNFESFMPYATLSNDEKNQVRYLQYNYHGINYSAPGLPPSEIGSILNNFIINNEVSGIYVKGHQKKIFLKKIISATIPIINVEYEFECPKFSKCEPPLCDSQCHSMTSNVFCATKNCTDLYNWLSEYF